MKIHKTAIVSKKSQIAETAEIGAYAMIEADVHIGAHTKIGHGSCVYSGTRIGENCRVFNNATLGAEPQDLSYKGEKSFLEIGSNNIIREYASIHRGSGKGSNTTLGDNNYLMAFVHIGHDCKIGSNVVICNNTLLGGHVEVEDKAFISGACTVHQFVRIGTLAMVAGGIRVVKDIPPFMLSDEDITINSYNVVGIRRAGISETVHKEIKGAYKILYMSGLNTTNALEKIEKSFNSAQIKHLIAFIRNSKRGISGRGRKRHNSA